MCNYVCFLFSSLLDDDVLLTEEKIHCLLSKTFSVGDSVLGVVKKVCLYNT